MPKSDLSDILVFKLGPAIAKCVLAICIKDVGLAADAGTDLLELLQGKISSARTKQQTARIFSEIGEQVAETFVPIFDFEAPGLDEGSRIAVSLALSETMVAADINAAMLASVNLDPHELFRLLSGQNTKQINHFEPSLIELYNHMLQQACYSIINVASTLPNFSEHTYAELFKRTDKIYEGINKILEEINHIQEDVKRLNSDPTHARFERDYSNNIVAKLGKLELFGIEVSASSQRYGLDTAYTTLRASWLTGKSPLVGTKSNPITRVLSETQRIFIKGEAGSGKSTLLQWVAVRAATRSFPDETSNWNGDVPFFVRLRQFINRQLPSPQEFIKYLTPAISDRIPLEWLEEILISGRAILLVDGIDELPSIKHQDILNWLSDLITNYPKIKIAVTSRPYAINQSWLDREKFDSVELERMSPSIVDEFVDRWHKAVHEELTDANEKEELEKCRISIQNAITNDRPVRELATNPLLCAMLCALNRQRHRDLPSQRVYLYESACRMLLEAREKRQDISREHYPNVEYDEGIIILQEIAYWMLTNDYKQATKQQIKNIIDIIKPTLPRLDQKIDSGEIYRYLVERSGIVREPQIEILDFVHLTFQEYLTAKSAVEKDNIGVLVKSAHDIQWRETIILASALAGESVRESIIKGIQKRAEENPSKRLPLYLIAISCANVSIKLNTNLSRTINNLAESLPPPKDNTEANDWARAGQLAIPFLSLEYLISREKKIRRRKLIEQANRNNEDIKKLPNPKVTIEDIPENNVAACVNALGIISGENALNAIQAFTIDDRYLIGVELGKAWEKYPRNTYAEQIISKCTTLSLSRLPNEDEIQYFLALQNLEIVDCSNLKDLSIISQFKDLQVLEIKSCYNIRNIEAIKELKELKILRLKYCPNISDISHLEHLSKIEEIDIYKCARNINAGNLREKMSSKLKISSERSVVNYLAPPKEKGDSLEKYNF